MQGLRGGLENDWSSSRFYDPRRTLWIQILANRGWDCDLEAIADAIRRERYSRILARRKPVLTRLQKAVHLRWAEGNANGLRN
jgi:hypothetical protein